MSDECVASRTFSDGVLFVNRIFPASWQQVILSRVRIYIYTEKEKTRESEREREREKREKDRKAGREREKGEGGGGLRGSFNIIRRLD